MCAHPVSELTVTYIKVRIPISKSENNLVESWGFYRVKFSKVPGKTSNCHYERDRRQFLRVFLWDGTLNAHRVNKGNRLSGSSKVGQQIKLSTTREVKGPSKIHLILPPVNLWHKRPFMLFNQIFQIQCIESHYSFF